jgi:non-lysosomal glucosylceramidase
MKRRNVHRRGFIKQGGLTTAAFLSQHIPSWAKHFIDYTETSAFPLHNIPAKKNIDPQWVKSLYKRGAPTTYSKSRNELKYIGMPAGGLHCGTLYLGGDGRLWLWGIYNDDREGVDPKTVLWNDGNTERKIKSRDGANYVEPTIGGNKRVLEQGFAVKLEYNNKTIIKELKEEDWDEISFTATYPIATVTYTCYDLPVRIVLKAGTFFIPLNAEDSALPATFFNITIYNTSSQNIKVSVIGWQENGAKKITAKDGEGLRQNKAIHGEGYHGVFCTYKASNEQAPASPDSGTMCLGLINHPCTINTSVNLFPLSKETFEDINENLSEKSPSDKLIAGITSHSILKPGQPFTTDYVLTWHFATPNNKMKLLVADAKTGYYYGKKFKDASEVIGYIAGKFRILQSNTFLWQQTWYRSTLPHWFLERSFVNIGTIATANTYRFETGRFWGWEGVGACEGTCTHVWQYAQAMGRIFPSIERDTRERVDAGIAMQQNGGILFRGENEKRPAIDGQAGTILRFYREHQMSTDNIFLQDNWIAIKNAVMFMLAQDKNGDGMTDTPMENTLDAVWEGEISWIVGLCIAAAKAAQMMAEEMHDESFADVCKAYVSKGCKNMADSLFNGEYFIHRPDAMQGRKKLGSYNTCHIDQVYGQSWAFQVGLGRLWDKEKTRSALRSLWKYNFATDVGPYIKTHAGGRPYAVEGESGMIMNTNPHNEPKPYGEDVTWQLGYFHECMTGFEHQVAAHMMAEGMTDEALILTRAIHNRYHAAKRNPYNEIECSDHYARAMASYGTFISACGFEYHGPKGFIRFNPAFSSNDFMAPFTTAAGWGTYKQKQTPTSFSASLDIKYGILNLIEIRFVINKNLKISKAEASLNGTVVACNVDQRGQDISIILKNTETIAVNQILSVIVT